MLLVGVAMVVSLAAAPKKSKIKYDYTDATKLTLVGKLCKTTNPYHRVEVDNVEGITKAEARLLKMASGLAVAFKTNATSISIKAEFGPNSSWNSYAPLASTSGFSLFIKDENGEWTWAAAKARKLPPVEENLAALSKPLVLISGLAEGEKECLIYLPLYSEMLSVKVGVNEGADIKKLKNPFRHNIAVFGSSFTHGSCASGCALTWPAFLMRATGLHLCSFGMSGNSKLQRVMGEILGKTKADAYICDAFSNPSIKTIGARINPFIQTVRDHNPEAPIIFLRTIYREARNFDTKVEKKEREREEYVEKLMINDILKKYKNVYFVNVKNQTGLDHETSGDGIHPHSMGYLRWAQTIEKPVMKILKKHKIK